MSSIPGRGEQYRYGFFRLAPRDELVFKSIVGLLSGRMLPIWVHAEDGQFDVLVVGSEAPAKARDLNWPLRANEIAERLKQAADILNRSTQLATAASLDQGATRVVKLSRWPANALLQSDPGYVRLAALLSTRAFSGYELAQRSGLSLELCLGFIAALEEQGCLLVIELAEEPVVEPITVATAPVKWFFARLRAHFGLPGTGSEAR